MFGLSSRPSEVSPNTMQTIAACKCIYF